MGKNFKLILTALICAGISFAQALSVGDIAVETALNQPLKAFVGLRNIGSVDAGQISISLAKSSDFEIADIEYLGFLNDLRFVVVPIGSNAAKVEITSKKAIREPYVNFLMAIVWPNGQILKEYTILLDPVFGDTSLASNTGSVATKVQAALVPRPSKYSPHQRKSQPQRSRLSRSNDTASSVTVLAEDTLWDIAKKVAPKGVSVHQVMHSIKQVNPNAFINNNINGLKAGYELAIPSAVELKQVSSAQAISATRRDTALWNGRAELSLDRSLTVSTKPVGELQLAVADDSSVAAGEQLDAITSENDGLLGRVGSLEEQVDDLNRLLELKNRQLALLQQQALVEVEPDVTEAGEKISTLSEPEALVVSEDEVIAVPSEDEPVIEIGSAASLAANQALKGAAPQKFEPVLEWWQQAPIQLASLAGVSVLLFGVLWLRRSRDEESFVVEDEDVILDVEEEADDFIPLPDEEAVDEEDTFDELENLSEQFKSQDYETAMASLEGKVTAQAHRADLRLLLLQKSSEADDKDRFIEHYRFLEAIAKPEDLQTAERILKASQGSVAWLNADAEDDDDFFKEIVHEAELTDEIEALLLASEGEASIDDFDFESFGEGPGLDEVSSNAENDEADDLGGIDFDVSDAADDQDMDFEETVILSPEANTINDDIESSDDSLDFDFDLVVEEQAGITEPAAETDSENDLDFESTIAIDSSPADLAVAELAGSTIDGDETAEVDLDFEDFSFGDDEPDVDIALSLGDENELELGEDDLSLDLDDFSEFDNLGGAAEELSSEALDDIDLDLDLGADDEVSLDEELIAGSGADDDRFDIDLSVVETGADEGSDELEEFSGFLDGADEAAIADEDEVATKLELGEAFVEMGDIDGAREILSEVLEEGDVVQQATARELLDKIDS